MSPSTALAAPKPVSFHTLSPFNPQCSILKELSPVRNDAFHMVKLDLKILLNKKTLRVHVCVCVCVCVCKLGESEQYQNVRAYLWEVGFQVMFTSFFRTVFTV